MFQQLVVHNTLQIAVYVFFYLIEQHSKFLLHTLQVLHMCTLCDYTNINTIIEFVPHKNAFSLLFAAILVNCAPSGEMHNYCTPHIKKIENFLIYRCNYILLSQVYCVWQVVKTATIILNNPVQWFQHDSRQYAKILSCRNPFSSQRDGVYNTWSLLVLFFGGYFFLRCR